MRSQKQENGVGPRQPILNKENKAKKAPFYCLR
jgi:hypothetical protein